MATGPELKTQDPALCALLRRLVVDPEGLAAGKGRQAVPSAKSVGGRQALERALSEGFVAAIHELDGLRYRLTPRGRAWLLDVDDPRELLEDLVRAVEKTGETVAALERNLRSLGAHHAATLELLGPIVAELRDSRRGAVEEVQAAEILDGAAGGDSPFAPRSLVDLFARLREKRPEATIGQFHDLVRRLHELGRLRLTPWTGPLSQLPNPELSLLIGHEVLYYVELQQRIAA